MHALSLQGKNGIKQVKAPVRNFQFMLIFGALLWTKWFSLSVVFFFFILS